MSVQGITRPFLLSIISIVPWLFMASGGIVHIGSFPLFLMGFCLAILVFSYVIFLGFRVNKLDRLNQQEILNKNVAYIFLVFFAFLLVKNFHILQSVGFNPQFARNSYFAGNGGVWGSVHLRMFYSYVIVPFFLLYLITKEKITRFDLLGVTLFCVANMLVGSRFVIYYMFLIFILRVVTFSPRFSFSRIFVVGLVLFFSAILLGFVRSYMSYDLTVTEASLRSFKSFYEYHSIQYGIYGYYEKSPLVLGPFTGIVSPFYTLIGGGSPESNIATFLHQVRFMGRFNAFGTSAFYFNFFGFMGFFAFIFSFAFITYFMFTIVPRKYKVHYVNFTIFSLYFSSFQPYAFGFSWWLINFYFLFMSTNFRWLLTKNRCIAH